MLGGGAGVTTVAVAGAGAGRSMVRSLLKLQAAVSPQAMRAMAAYFMAFLLHGHSLPLGVNDRGGAVLRVRNVTQGPAATIDAPSLGGIRTLIGQKNKTKTKYLYLLFLLFLRAGAMH